LTQTAVDSVSVCWKFAQGVRPAVERVSPRASHARDTKTLYLTRAQIHQRRQWFLRDFEYALNENRLVDPRRRNLREIFPLKNAKAGDMR
jgi:hypothetical protein